VPPVALLSRPGSSFERFAPICVTPCQSVCGISARAAPLARIRLNDTSRGIDYIAVDGASHPLIGIRPMPDQLDRATPTLPLIRKAIQLLESTLLILIAVFAVVAVGQEVYEIVQGMRVSLKDLLLMFIYVEVLAMVGVYYESKKIPITLPLFIAITALARLLILQGKDQPPANLLYESGAILILALACAVITYRPGRKIGGS
jgi:protein PsiE